jgi:hypothetical protein
VFLNLGANLARVKFIIEANIRQVARRRGRSWC